MYSIIYDNGDVTGELDGETFAIKTIMIHNYEGLNSTKSKGIYPETLMMISALQ